mgnify:CR=1 FL=1
MSKFKVGDKVIRIRNSTSKIQLFDTDIVIRVEVSGWLILENHVGSFDPLNFELVVPATPASPWVKINAERSNLPKENSFVLVTFQDTNKDKTRTTMEARFGNGHFYDPMLAPPNINDYVTHWMPLPEPAQD